MTTGIGAVINTAKVEIGSKAIVFGLGGIGLNVLQGLRLAGADMIVGVDLNPSKVEGAKRFGMTHFVNPKDVGDDIVPYLVNMTKRNGDTIGGADYTFDCTGNTKVMRQALRVRIAAGASRSSSALLVPARKSPPVRSSWSPAATGWAPPSAARADVPMCRKSWSGTWKARSRSIR